MQYCFYLDWHGLSSIEWAAWVQAVGSIGVFLLAILLPWRDRRRAAKEYAAIRAQEQRSSALQALRRLESQMGWLMEAANAPAAPWGHMVDPFGQYAADPGTSGPSLGAAGPAFEEFIARCQEAWSWCMAMAQRDPENQDRQSEQARGALEKVQGALAAAQILRTQLHNVAGIRPPPRRNP